MNLGRYFKLLFLGLFVLKSVSAQGAAIGLGNYALADGPVSVSGVTDNLSGITFNATTNSLFSVVNAPVEIRELNTDGGLLRTISLPSGIVDTEGIVYLGGTMYAFTEERERNVVILDMSNVGTGNTISSSSLTVLSLDIPGSYTGGRLNEGLEGIAYDSETGTMYVANEKNTPAIYTFSLSAAMAGKASGATTRFPVNVFPMFSDNSWGLSDIAGLHYDSVSGSLLVLSEESKKLIEIGTTGADAGQELSSISLSFIEQPEGVTMGDDGRIYVVSEANKFYSFVGPDTAVPEPGGGILLGAALLMWVGRRRR
jgi:uncharacterized protein YjiK